MSQMLKVQGLYKIFFPGTSNEVRALRGVDLTIEEEEFIVIIGTNGSGKSTLLNMIAGTFLPDAGKIFLDGRNITHHPEHKRAYFIGRVFQDPFRGTAPNMTVAENFALAAKRGKRRGLGWALRQNLTYNFQASTRSLNLGLEERMNSLIGNLSGGQRQALTLLMATYQKPKLLLLDEHTAALDPKSADIVIKLTAKIVAEQKLTALMVTHSMQQAANLGTRLVMMDKGQIIHNFKGSDKKHLRPDDLLQKFEQIRREEQLDETAAEMLRRNYV